LIREALIELEHQGFVQRTPFSGTQIPTITFEDVMQICDMRIALEPLACRLAAGKVHPQAIQQLELLLSREKKEVENGNLDLFLETQLPFRQTIWRLSGNKYLEQTLERLVVPLYALYLRSMRRNEGLHRSIPRNIAHQEQILEAFRVGRVDDAAETTENFLIFVKSALAERLR
jgi:DNA-binding GntR family transcriptional regulator